MNKKIIIMTACFFVLAKPAAIAAGSMDVKDTDINSLNIQFYSNQTEYRFKIINGKLYKRLWSYTYNCWEEPNWTPVN